MRNRLRALALAAAVMIAIPALATPAPALAAKGGKPAAATSSSSITLNQTGSLKLGDSVNFTTSAVGLGGNEWPMVYLTCYQGSNLVYGELAKPDYTFLLGGGWSVWREVGGSATCAGHLYAYSNTGNIRLLADSASFAVAGS